MIEVIDPGRWTSVQDRGRAGLERFGIPPGGAADWFSAAVANRLVGNQGDAALLEVTIAGPSLRFEEETMIAITGGDRADVPAGFAHPHWRARPADAGSVLQLGRVGPGLRSYVAIRGGIDVPILLGSRSFCARGGFGGGVGRPLQKGDRLAIGNEVATAVVMDPWPESHRLPLTGPWEIRVIPGPHLEAFDAGAVERLCTIACRVTPAIDRMGMRLETPGLRLQADEILTTPVTAGAIQVTPSAELILLLVDHPTTGGYPVIATVIAADLPRLAQARPGDTIRFRPVDQGEAARAQRRLTDWLIG